MDDARINELETQVAFLREEMRELLEASREKDRVMVRMEARMERMEAALRLLNARVESSGGEVGANAEEDPVPASG